MHPFILVLVLWTLAATFYGALWATIGLRRKALRQKIDFTRHGEGITHD